MTMMVMMITYDDAAGTRHPYEADTEAEVDEVEEEDDGGDDDNDDDSDAESSLISAQDMGTCRHCQIAPRTWGLATIAEEDEEEEDEADGGKDEEGSRKRMHDGR